MKPIRTVLPLAVALLSAAPALSGGLQPPIVEPVAARLAFAEACPGVEAALGQLGRQGYAGFVLRLGAERARIEATGPDGVARSFGWSCGTAARRALLAEDALPPEGAAAGPRPDGRDAAPELRVAGRDSSTSHRQDRDPAAPVGGGATVAPGPDLPAPPVGGEPELGGTPVLGGGGTDKGGTPVADGGGTDLGGGGGSVAPGQEGSGQGGSGQGGSGGSEGGLGGGGCNDREDDENNARHDNCGHGNNAGGDDADNPGEGEGQGPAGGRGGDGPGLGGVGGQAAGGPGAGGQGGGQGGAPAAG